jgi:putative hydrolase of the HAD superfamily
LAALKDDQVAPSGGEWLKPVKWLVFDAVGTLIEPRPSVADAYHGVAVRHGSGLSVSEIGERFRRAFRASETDGFPGGPPRGAMWLSSDLIEEARWRWIVSEVIPDANDPDDCFRELWSHFARPTSWRAFDDVSEALRRLSNDGYRLAIASNFDRRLHAVCDALPGLRAIELRVVSAAVGYRKPAPEFYAEILSACACDASDLLMIGDNHEHDVAGPRAAGLQAVHLDRHGAASGPSHLTSLSELADRLDGKSSDGKSARAQPIHGA